MNIIDRLASFVRSDKAVFVKYLETLKADGWNVQHEFSGDRVEVSIDGDFTGFEYEGETVNAEQVISAWIQYFDN